MLGGRKHDAFRQRVIELAELRGDEDILDAGCGTGLTTLRIAAQYPECRVHGIDLSPKMIEVARNDAAERGLDVDLRIGSITDLPYPDACLRRGADQYHVPSPRPGGEAAGRRRDRAGAASRAVASSRPSLGRAPATRVERRLAKGEYTLYPSHLAEAGLTLRHEELSPFVWGLQVTYRVAVKPDEAASRIF